MEDLNFLKKPPSLYSREEERKQAFLLICVQSQAGWRHPPLGIKVVISASLRPIHHLRANERVPFRSLCATLAG